MTARSHWHQPTSKTVFLGVLLVIIVGYTEIAFGMEWRNTAGRIGAGFFPRIIGVCAAALTLIALVQSLYDRSSSGSRSRPEDAASEQGDLGRHPLALLVAVAAGAVFAATLSGLGAVVSSALFMFGMLWFLNRRRLVLNIVLSVTLPLGLYLLLQTLLNAGLPAGILPSF